MKYAIVIPDGCADEPQPTLGGKTPLQAARMPNATRLATMGRVGRANNVPEHLTPASDVATLSLFGYDPSIYYTGRAPLEAAALGIQLGANDWAVRCNLVTVANGLMRDFTAGHVKSEEARQLLDAVRAELGQPDREFHPGVSYRNLMVLRGSGELDGTTQTQPPHDIPDHPIAQHLPRGSGAEMLRDLMERSQHVLAEHPVNRARLARGERPATQIWLWGQGFAPSLKSFQDLYGPRGVMLTGVDLVRGVAALIGWDRLEVPGVTDYLDNDYEAQGRAAVGALKDYDLVCVHVEAPDEASHEGRLDAKIAALEAIDDKIIGPLLDALPSYGNWRLLVSPDHPTPVRTRAHARGFVPFVMGGTGIEAIGACGYDETVAARSTFAYDPGYILMTDLVRENR